MIEITIIDRDAKRRLLHVKNVAESPVELFRKIHHHQQAMSGLMFRNLKHGGSKKFRGVSWPWFAPQYTRKTDGVTVPAEGGVPRLDGRGVVLGKLRRKDSDVRINEQSNLLRDTVILANAVASVKRIRGGGRVLEMITPVKYAQYQQDRRPFTFFTDEDAKKYAKWAAGEFVK